MQRKSEKNYTVNMALSDLETVSEAELGWVRGEEGFSTLAPPRSEGGGGRVGGEGGEGGEDQ